MITKIHEDEHLLIVDKPVGLTVNRSHTTTGPTLQDLLEEDYTFVGDNEAFISRSGLVHRLDKDTSGVIVVAKDQDTFQDMLRQFKQRQVSKEYIAVVHGDLSDPILEIEAPIGRNPKFPFKFAVVSDGKASRTRVERVKQVDIDGVWYSLVTVFPKTGRTHQIRVHLAALGNFVARDPIYCSKNLFDNDLKTFTRMMLHAQSIAFKHPETGKLVEYYSEKPDDFDI